ncbi:hypothetical protein V5O48_013005 [Marasmius crinis-equi]|uniref:Uncharacterized protein n=1 Tax=Marasmius crinis-equi TaxID=585013 RepID=A0ABR3F177_9AGAR
MLKRNGSSLFEPPDKRRKKVNQPLPFVHSVSLPTNPKSGPSATASGPSTFLQSVATSSVTFSWKNIGTGLTWRHGKPEEVDGEDKMSQGAVNEAGNTGKAGVSEAGEGKPATVKEASKKKRSVVSRHPNIEWKTKHRPLFVEELIRSKGRGDARWQTRCSDCKDEVEEATDEKGRCVAFAVSEGIGITHFTLWRNGMMVICSGRGEEDCTGLEEEAEGVLRLRCLSCPYPDINLPTDWKEKARGPEGFLYRLVLCMDANFRLKEQLVSVTARAFFDDLNR